MNLKKLFDFHVSNEEFIKKNEGFTIITKIKR